jgi:hypothetical protein
MISLARLRREPFPFIINLVDYQTQIVDFYLNYLKYH